VLHGLASFEEVPPSVEEIARRRGDIVARGLPYLVAEREGRIVAIAMRVRPSPYWLPLHARGLDLYRCRRSGAGIGRRLLAPLIERCTELGYRQMIAVIGGRETALDPPARSRLGLRASGSRRWNVSRSASAR